MKLNIPFFKQTTDLNCGPAALRMGAAFLNTDPGMQAAEDAINIQDGKGVSTIRIAIGAKKLNLAATFYSKSLTFDQAHAQKEFYKQFADVDLQASIQLVQEAKDIGVELH